MAESERFLKVTWDPSGRHIVEMQGIRKMSEIRKMCMYTLRHALRHLQAGRRFEDGVTPADLSRERTE